MSDHEFVDITLRRVRSRGWFYILAWGGREQVRGEFQRTAADALDAGLEMLQRLGEGA